MRWAVFAAATGVLWLATAGSMLMAFATAATKRWAAVAAVCGLACAAVSYVLGCWAAPYCP